MPLSPARVVLVARRRDQRIDAGRLARLDALLTAEAAVGDQAGHRTRHLALCDQRRQHRFDLLLVIGGLRHPNQPRQTLDPFERRQQQAEAAALPPGRWDLT